MDYPVEYQSISAARGSIRPIAPAISSGRALPFADSCEQDVCRTGLHRGPRGREKGIDTDVQRLPRSKVEPDAIEQLLKATEAPDDTILYLRPAARGALRLEVHGFG